MTASPTAIPDPAPAEGFFSAGLDRGDPEAAAIIGRPINYRAVVSSFDATIRCVRAGLGVAIMPREILGMAGPGQGV